MVEPLAGLRRGGSQRLGGEDDITAKARVLGDINRVGVHASPEHPTHLAMQQGAATTRRARGKCGTHELVPKPEASTLIDHQPTGDGLLDVAEQVDHRTVQYGGEQVQVQPRANNCSAAQRCRGGRTELVAAGRHHLDERRRQRRRVRGGCKLDEEQRVAARHLIQLVGRTFTDQRRGGGAIQRPQRDPLTRWQERALAGPHSSHDNHCGTAASHELQ